MLLTRIFTPLDGVKKDLSEYLTREDDGFDPQFGVSSEDSLYDFAPPLLAPPGVSHLACTTNFATTAR